MDYQDWTPVIIKKTKKVVTTAGPAKQHLNKQETSATVTKYYDPNDPDADPETRPVLIGRELGQKFQKARVEKGLTQKELANALSIPVNIVTEYEKGTGVRNGATVSKLKKYLNIS